MIERTDQSDDHVDGFSLYGWCILNRTDVVKSVAHKEGLPVAVVEKAVTGLLDIITLSLAAGEEVNLRRFGKFEPRDRKAVIRKNPRTGVEIKVPEKVSVGFIPSPALKARLNHA